jgi:hypothetical protein
MFSFAQCCVAGLNSGISWISVADLEFCGLFVFVYALGDFTFFAIQREQGFHSSIG